jgi:hypothetical protein
VGRLPFVFFAGVVLMIVISLLWLLTPQVGSHESRFTFSACIALSLWFLNTGMPTRRVLALVGIYATLHIGLSAYFGQGIFSPRINWLYLIPILMIRWSQSGFVVGRCGDGGFVFVDIAHLQGRLATVDTLDPRS